MVTLQEVDTNESTAAVAIIGLPTTMPTAESEVVCPEPVRMLRRRLLMHMPFDNVCANV